MESVYLNQFVNKDIEISSSDINEPFSFLEWRRRRPELVEKQAVNYYNLYIIEWFHKNKEKKISSKFLLKQKYLYLLFQLQVFFTEDEKHNWYNKINFSEENELLLSIPFFARKLKQIALYYLSLRKTLKNTKLKYNLAGTSFGLEQEIYNLLSRTFTDSVTDIQPSIFRHLPQLSGVRNSIVVQVEELYDDVDYYDKSTTLPVSSYYNFFHHATEKFYSTKGINLSSSEWIFNCLTLSATQNLDALVGQITGLLSETTSSEEYGEFFKTYFSENKYTTTFVQTTTTPDIIDINIQEGNNVFYYPYGLVDPSILFKNQIAPVALSSLQIKGATSGTILERSDTLFIKNGNDVKGAWLYYKQFQDTKDILRAFLTQNSTTSFIFPFPGYGLSGEDMSWTGRSTRYTPGYNYLSNDIKTLVNKEYWNSPFESSDVAPVFINNTTLVSQKATSNSNPKFADNITISVRSEQDNLSPSVDTEGAWLYKLQTTAWPIGLTSKNVFLWPFHLIDTEQEELSRLYSNIYMKDVCDTVAVSSLNFSFAVASSSIDTADKIYKLHNFSDDISLATECCWLSSQVVTFGSHYKACEQNGFSALFESGQTTRFLWTGPTTDLSAAFVPNIKHKPECYFSTANLNLTSGLEWQKCTCKQVYYSPFGHPEKELNQNNNFADFIALDAENNLATFDMDSWRGAANSRFLYSEDVAWYKTNKSIGWGDGNWVSNGRIGGDPFKLEPGKAYFYRRAGSRLSFNTFPAYSVNYDFKQTPTKWITARRNEDDEWVSVNKISGMKFRPGDFVKYERAPSTQCWLISSQLIENQSANLGSMWSTFDYIVSGSTLDTTYISWPTTDGQMLSDPQIPPASFYDIERLDYWDIQHTTYPWLHARYYSTHIDIVIPPVAGGMAPGYTSTISNNKMSFSFTPPEIGVYTISVSATAKGIGPMPLFTDIPALTVVPPYRQEELLLNFKFPASGFLFEKQLTGWNYNANRPKPKAVGAKPYWAELYFDRQPATRFGGIRSWGFPYNFIEDYIPDHNPRLSLLELQSGTIFKYKRNGYDLLWSQPFTFKTYSGTSVWCELSSNTNNSSNLSSLFETKRIEELNVFATFAPSDIQLTNIKNSLPVEIYYNALNSFTWSVTSEIQTSNSNDSSVLSIESSHPWSNLGDRHFATIATIPVLEDIYSIVDVGGYFLPQHLGASQFINRDFQSFVKDQNLNESILVEDKSIHIGGRGRSKQDQHTVYDWREQNQWMKEPPTAGAKAGSVKSIWTKTLQTFLPYEENNETVPLGLITPSSRVSPWGGSSEDEWTDTLNRHDSFTGIPNVSAWAATQILKNNKQVVDYWVTDVFGNQYGLYKDLSNSAVGTHHNKTGELWVKCNNNRVLPASQALSSVFESFTSKSFHSELTGSGIKTIDCFFDTLVIETNTTVLLLHLQYDYEAEIISINVDNTIIISDLQTKNWRFERSWLMPKTKTATMLFTELTATTFTPKLFTLNLADRTYVTSFPTTIVDYANVRLGLSGIEVKHLDRAAYYYNSLQQTGLITYKGVDVHNKLFFVDFEIEHQEDFVLTTINRFTDTTYLMSVHFPPIVESVFFNPFDVMVSTPFTISIPALNSPLNYEILGTYPFFINVTSTGDFTGNIPLPGIYNINYRVINHMGYTAYSLTLNVT